MSTREVKSVCWCGGAAGCHGGCGVILKVKDEKVVKVEGDPEFPTNGGRLCPKVLALTQVLYHKDRLIYPLKRVGERGENKWKRISWSEAFDEISGKILEIKNKYSAKAVAIGQGTGRIYSNWRARLAYSFGTPNNFTACYICYCPRGSALAITTGGFLEVDCAQFFPDRYDDPRWQAPKCIVIWANEPLRTSPDGFYGPWIVDCMKRGSKLIVVDPKCTWLASRSNIWLQIRPATDDALALGMLNIIINEELYDKEFVEKWTYGFKELSERVKKYTPDLVSDITWVPKEKMIEAARMFATSKPAAIKWGVPLDHTSNAVNTARAIICLMAITGNIDVPGGNIFVKPSFDVLFGERPGFELMPRDVWEDRLGKEFKLTSFFFYICHLPSIWEAILTEKPYPVKALILFGSNPLVAYANPKRILEALKKLDLFVAIDLFMTPTTLYADYILPAAAWPEFDTYRAWWAPLTTINKAAEPPAGEEGPKSDYAIILELGRRIAPEHWKFNNTAEVINEMIKGSGLNFEELKRRRIVWDPWLMEYKKYEKGLLRPDGKPGFYTPTGKIELYSTICHHYGLDPLPDYKEPVESPIRTPELVKEYPLVLTTGDRTWSFFHSEGRQIPWLREINPDPVVEIHPETAEKLGIKDGDWVWIESRRGRCKQKAKTTPLVHPRVVHAQHAWWFPEKGPENLFGVWDSNINLVTDISEFDPYMGTHCIRGLLVKVYKA